jgi:hypothetical protein
MTGAEILQDNFNWHINNIHWYILFALIIVVWGWINSYRESRKNRKASDG